MRYYDCSEAEAHALLAKWYDIRATLLPTQLNLVGRVRKVHHSKQALEEVTVGGIYINQKIIFCVLTPLDQEGYVWACDGSFILRLPLSMGWFDV